MFLLLAIAGLTLPACGKATVASASKVVPGKVEKIEGSKLSRLVLIQDASNRIALQTVPVREETVVRTRKVGGEVVESPQAAAADTDTVMVRVFMSESDVAQVDRTQPARILALTEASDSNAQGAEATIETGMNGDSTADDGDTALYFKISDPKFQLAPGQRVMVAIALTGSGLRKIIPYEAVLYDPKGETWTYTAEQPLAFIRHPITVDYIDNGMAVLTEGPATGTPVVTIGAAELFGLEFGAGK